MANDNNLYNENDEFILHFFPLDEKHVEHWADLLDDDEMGRLLKAIWLYELKKTGSYDDTGESRNFKACLNQFRRDYLPGARISAERKHLGRVEGGRNSHGRQSTKEANKKDDEYESEKERGAPFKPPSKTAFRKIAFSVIEDLMQHGRRTDKISIDEAYHEYDYLCKTEWKVCGDRPIRSEEELKSLLHCLYDEKLTRLFDRESVPSPVVLGAELLKRDKLQSRGVFCWGGLLRFAECLNTSFGNWIVADVGYNTWREAFIAFIADQEARLSKVKLG